VILAALLVPDQRWCPFLAGLNLRMRLPHTDPVYQLDLFTSNGGSVSWGMALCLHR
jgi:hypothetical protein